MKVMTPTNFRKDMFKILKDIAHSNDSIELTVNQNSGLNDGVILISKREWETLQEELYLQRTGVLDHVLDLMEDESEDDFEEI